MLAHPAVIKYTTVGSRRRPLFPITQLPSLATEISQASQSQCFNEIRGRDSNHCDRKYFGSNWGNACADVAAPDDMFSQVWRKEEDHNANRCLEEICVS